MTTSAIVYLISFYAAVGGVDPKVALAVAQHESNLNPKAIGSLGEIGLYQIRPQYVAGISKKQLANIVTNIKVGVRMLKEAKDVCGKKCKGLDYLTIYNCGRTAAKRIKNPSLFPYVLAVKKHMQMNAVKVGML